MRKAWRAPLVALLWLILAIPVGAQDPGPTAAPIPTPSPTATPTPVPSDAERPWPSGDQLRRDLQQIGFVFRIDADAADWLGWAPLSGLGEAPALVLAGAGTLPAAVTFELGLIDADPATALTAFMEVAARVPLAPSDSERMRRFVVDDLLETPAQLLERCYLSDWNRGVALVSVDGDGLSAQVFLAESEAALPVEGDDRADCASLVPAEVAARLGDPSSERLTIALGGDPVGFEPADVTFEGALVTVVLTFRNDTAAEQSLTFDAPVSSTTGVVAPGELKLIVVRQLEPGEYAYSSDSDPEALRGTLRIEAPSAD